MSGTWNRTLIYLGLREEPEELHEEHPQRFVPEDDPHAEHAPPRPSERAASRGGAGPSTVDVLERPVEPAEPADGGESNVRALRSGDVNVRPLKPQPALRAAVIEVDAFEDVEAIGSRYRTNQPVLFDAAGADTAVARRVLDFVSGLTFASRGRLTKVGNRAFLLVPTGGELPEEELDRLRDLGYRLPSGSEE